MSLVHAALRAPYTVIVAVLAVVVLGVTSVGRMPVDLLPQFQTPAVQIVTFYPGMPAEVMEKDITSRLERWTGQSVGIARQESRSMIGVSIVKDFFHENIDPAAAIAQVSSYAMSDLFYLPPGTIPPMVMPFDPTASLPLALITVSSTKFDETKLYDVAYFDLRNRLQGIPGVIAPAVYGGKLRRILAYADRDRLQARRLSPMDVVGTLKGFSTLIPTGSAKIGDFDYQILTNGMPEHVAEMNDFPVKIENGVPVYVRDVGEVQDSHQIQTNVVRISAAPEFQSKRQVYIPIYRQPGSNTIQIVDGIRAALGSILARLPEDINLTVVMDQSVYVRQAIRSLADEGWLGSGLAALMILLFIGNLRSALIITLAIPLSILAAFIGRAAAVPEAEFSFHTGGLMAAALNFGLPSPIDIQITGNDLQVGRGIAEQIRDAIAGVPGAVDVRIPQRLDYPAITVTVDRVRAANLGLTPKAVVQNIVTSLNSSINFDPAFWIDTGNGNHYFLGAQCREADITSLSTLENIPITMDHGAVLEPEYSRIKAPFDGLVTERFVDPGALIQAATGSANVTPIVTVARVDRVRTFVDIPEREVPFISTANTATLAPSAFASQTFAGHVTRFAGALNPATRTMRTEVDFENPEGRLYPGMYGSLTLALEVHAEAVTLPSAAVTSHKDGKSFVYVVTNGTAHQKPVRVGVDDGVCAEILSGLDGSEECVVTASGSIVDGAAVQVTDTSTTRAGS